MSQRPVWSGNRYWTVDPTEVWVQIIFQIILLLAPGGALGARRSAGPGLAAALSLCGLRQAPPQCMMNLLGSRPPEWKSPQMRIQLFRQHFATQYKHV